MDPVYRHLTRIEDSRRTPDYDVPDEGRQFLNSEKYRNKNIKDNSSKQLMGKPGKVFY